MLSTFSQVSQGVLTGLGIVAASAGLVYVASTNGLDVQLRMGGSTFAVSAPVAAAAMADETSADVSEPEKVALGAGQRTVAADTEPELPVRAVPVQQADQYYDQVAADLSLQVVSLKRLGVLLQEPDNTSYAWRNEVVRLSGLLEDSYRRLSWVRPPKDAVELHSFVVEASSRCLSIASSLNGDLGQLDADTMNLIGGTLHGCTEDVMAALQSIQ